MPAYDLLPTQTYLDISAIQSAWLPSTEGKPADPYLSLRPPCLVEAGFPLSFSTGSSKPQISSSPPKYRTWQDPLLQESLRHQFLIHKIEMRTTSKKTTHHPADPKTSAHQIVSSATNSPAARSVARRPIFGCLPSVAFGRSILASLSAHYTLQNPTRRSSHARQTT